VALRVWNPRLVRKHKRFILCALLATALGLVGTETVLRKAWGFGKPALCYRDPDFGYAFKPGQNLHRFGNRIFYNSEGLRSEPVLPQKPRYLVRVLCVGDSVTNGGALTDQNETYPYMMRDLLLRADIQAEALNASAGSWGVENELAFMHKKGTFGADFVVLQIGTHDLWQRRAWDSIVVSDPNFPEHPPLLAITELLTRYLKPRLLAIVAQSQPAIPRSALSEEDRVRCLQAIREMVQFIRGRSADPVVLLTPGLDELNTLELYRTGREGLLKLGAEMRVPIIDMLPKMRVAAQKGISPFRDDVHPNPIGNSLMAEEVATHIVRKMGSTH
jgi:lysophospholipase L1-like esterase